jgi:CII-binding regulator of phage lambda lysogenization HflD
MVAVSEKQAYLQKLSARLKQKEIDIEKMQAKIDAAKGDLGKDYLQAIDDLRMKKDTVTGNMKQLQESGDEVWDEIKQGVDKSWSDLRDTFSTVYAMLR